MEVRFGWVCRWNMRCAPRTISRSLSLGVSIAIFLIMGLLSSRAQSPAPANAGVNAADLYRSAMDMYGQLTTAEKDMLSSGNLPSNAAAADLHANLQPIMDTLRSARTADYSDWGPPPASLSENDARAQVTTGRQMLATITQWEAAWSFKTDPAIAVGDIAAQEAIARSDVPHQLGLLVQAGIHISGIRLLNRHVADIPQSSASDIQYIVDPAAQGRCIESAFNGKAAPESKFIADYGNPATRTDSYIQKLIDENHLKVQVQDIGNTFGSGHG